MKKLLHILLSGLLLGVSTVSAQADSASPSYVFTTIDYPGASYTLVTGISGNDIVGTYTINGIKNGFLYDGTTYSTVDVPGATANWVWGISGNNIVGMYLTNGPEYGSNNQWHSFLYNGKTYTNIDVPGKINTEALGISGNNIVGYNEGSSFLYNGTSYTNINFPGGITWATGISGNNIVGAYTSGSNPSDPEHGFIFNGSSYTTIDVPGASLTTTYDSGSSPWGISGNNIVGYYTNGGGTHGFLYDGKSYYTIDFPGAAQGTSVWSQFTGTEIFAIQGNVIGGSYSDSNGAGHGFIGTPSSVVPIPGAVWLFGSAFAGFIGFNRRKTIQQ